MKHTLLGTKKVDFTTADGKNIQGTTLYLAYEAENAEVVGMVTDKIFVPAAKMPKKALVVGSDIDITFNRFGKVDSIYVD